MKLENLKIFGEDCCFHTGSITIDGDRFSDVELGDVCDCARDDADACQPAELYALPGFVDIHFHGAAGVDFCDASVETLAIIARYEAEHGTLAICPATMTYPEDRLMPVMQTAAQFAKSQFGSSASGKTVELGADLIGINMEGPFISPNKVGGQNPDFVQAPNAQMLRRLDEASGGLVKLVDVAPEVDGCIEFIRSVSADYRVSIAHTCATYEDALAAIDAGAAHLTHTFNAMPGIAHREPGPIAAAAEAANSGSKNSACNAMQNFGDKNSAPSSPQFHAEIICDGHHVSAPAIRLAFKLFAPHAICIIADSCEATGMPDGNDYHLGGQNIVKRDGLAYLESEPNTIAASATNQYDCFRYAVLEAGIPLHLAVSACTINPATAIGQQRLYGSIAPGKYANLLLVDSGLNIQKIFLHGIEI